MYLAGYFCIWSRMITFANCLNGSEGEKVSDYYPPSCYFTYRVDDANQMTQVEQNCLLWQQLTDGSIPEEDIREVIYKWKYEDVQYMLGIFGKIEYYFSEGNKFADWIFLHGDREAAECVLLAKECEHLRKVRHKDPWYYSWEADEVNVSLSRLAERAQAYAGDRLRMSGRNTIGLSGMRCPCLPTRNRPHGLIGCWDIIKKRSAITRIRR